jgi:hypothetical protein
VSKLRRSASERWKRRADKERQEGLGDDAAARWLADHDADCDHVWATIAHEGGTLSHYYCPRCGQRSPA